MTRIEALKVLAKKVEAGEEYLERAVQDVWGGYRGSDNSKYAIHAYHGSTDAAISLHNDALPEAKLAILQMLHVDGEWRWTVRVFIAGGGPSGLAVSSVLSRAILLSDIRALIAQEEST